MTATQTSPDIDRANSIASLKASNRSGSSNDPLLSVRHLTQEFNVTVRGKGRRRVHAVSDVSFDIGNGETVALVGESGCGKSSLARAILQSPSPVSGEVVFHGNDLTNLRGSALHSSLLGMQVVFQDPYGSLDPHWRVNQIVAEPLRANGIGNSNDRDQRVAELLEAVGLDAVTHGHRRPRELSGGQCQRVAIARALALNPSLLICDEPVSSLDVSVQARILNLFEDLREKYGLAYLFITHDLSVAKHVSDRVAVMYLGKIVEQGIASDIFSSPLHPYSAALLSAIPDPDLPHQAHRIHLVGELPSAAEPPSGCRFRTRCPFAQQRCADEEPKLVLSGNGHSVACHYPLVSGEF